MTLDKAKVENAVLLVERWILAALRHHRFFTLAELNEAIGQLLEKLNLRPFRKREGTRTSLFVAVDQPALQPLPAERYLIASWKTVRANIDYHVEKKESPAWAPTTSTCPPMSPSRRRPRSMSATDTAILGS